MFCPALPPFMQANELLSLKPTLAKKLSDKIKSLQTEIEVLRSDTKVNALERKVQVRPISHESRHMHAHRLSPVTEEFCAVAWLQRLELELKQSYATKNFTLKSGLMEIEKSYHDFIHAREDVEVRGCL